MKKITKTLLCVLLAFVICFSAGCKPSADPDGDTGNPSDFPSEPELELNDPQDKMPDISDDELLGSANIGDSKYDGVINLKKTTAEFTGKNISVKSDSVYGTVVEITASGTYIVQGTLENGFIAIAKKELQVTLVLNGVNIYCGNYPAIVCTKKSDVTIELSENSKNYLTDGTAYVYDYDVEHEPNACLYIRKDLTICGSGALTVNSNFNNGIGTKANLTITSGVISANAVNNALKGNDSIVITGGSFRIVSHEDGIKSDNTEDEGLGYIDISGGSFELATVGDAVQSSTYLKISNAQFSIKTELVSGTNVDSFKGLKADTLLTIESGIFVIYTYDDAIHSNGDIIINGGTINIHSGDDGIHADKNLTINSGTITIVKSYEGLESENINLNGGVVKITASDDGINIAGGADGSAWNPRPGGMPGTPGKPGQSTISGTLTITGGTYYVSADGDGIDSNGHIVMSGGLVIVNGPTADMNASIDYDGSFAISGGTLIALGSAGMAQQPGSSSSQYTVMVRLSSAVSAGSLINIKSSSGADLITVVCVKNIRSIVISSPELNKGSYTVSTGGTYSAPANEFGIYTGGTYTGGSVKKTFTVSNTVTNVN